jgi:hypothetical protein
MKSGRQVGAKLWGSLIVARQLNAAEQGVDEHRPAASVNCDVVDIEVARGPAQLGHVDAVVALVRLSGRQRILEPPELVEAAHYEPIRARPEAHAPLERAVEDRQPAIGLQAEQEQLAGLVGGEGEAGFLLGEPRRELPRGGQLKGGGARLACVMKAAGRAGHAGTSWRPRASDAKELARLAATKVRCHGVPALGATPLWSARGQPRHRRSDFSIIRTV